MSQQKDAYLVFGSSSGIGKALATMLVAKGERVIGISRRHTDLKGIESLSLDITQPDLKRQLTCYLNSHNLTPKWVINCVGVGYYAPFDLERYESWRKIIETNLLGLMALLNFVATDQRVTHLVMIGSLAAKRPSKTPGNHLYGATKGAADELMSHFRTEIRQNSRTTKVTVIHPGFVKDTDFTASFFNDCQEHATDLLSHFDPLTPEDVAEVIINTLTSPTHVDISEVILRPLFQPD
ncbi:short chain dehydrogenase [Pseudomonas sp. NFACC23-1]|uniref:SDR family oxidoreductase n=1 Tax=unclassified Pseudomonas TaxID=196821 RepID=UPI00088EAEBE|nr:MULTISPECIES: SDR family NAD(P)-dependent oxidoreductase [unclassified Pseudomonas]SDB53334.1 short chain dehydrogenase [Pseudomonas sp. NFACC17-2]SEJ73485.1 short chain dehydrogenase [Pseudomonas sp. NFACC23-1]SFW74189.1 short chain dehydrogenase [Pseudomonas sp. NFACC16-2]